MILTLSIIFIGCQNKIDPNHYIFKKDTYISPINDNIEIDIPQIENDNLTSINELIKDTVVKYVLEFYDNDLTGLTLNLSYEISYNSADLISIKFHGVGYKGSVAYPNNLFKSINIDIQKEELVKLTDLYEIDYSFAETYIKEFKKQIPEDRNIIIDNYSKEELIEYFNQSDGVNSFIMSFYTKDKVGISISVPHVIGDHIEIELDKKSINNNFID